VNPIEGNAHPKSIWPEEVQEAAKRFILSA
jgi:hypothetical protein